jgi:polysaccharide chain length determinant protein (PEP-CTERM system associated)
MTDVISQLYAYATAMWLRRWQALTVAWLLCVAGWILVAFLPDKYESSARIYADTKGMLQPLLKGLAVENDIDRDIEIMQRTLMSRPNLEKLARMTDLDLTVKTASDMEDLVERLANQIGIRPQGKNLFSVTYQDTRPEMAKRVVQSLLTIFVESNLGQSRKDMDSARRFIDEQIEIYQQQLEIAEAKLAKFKQDNLGLLPGQGGYYDRLDKARAELALAQGEYAEAETRRQELRRQLDSVPRTLATSVATTEGTGPPLDDEFRVIELQNQIDELLVRYTERHPDVVAARRRLEEIRKEMEAQAAAAPGRAAGATEPSGDAQPAVESTASNPVYEQIKLQLVQEEANFATLRSRVARHQAKVAELQRLAQSVPTVEADLTKLTRDYRIFKQNYEELLARRESAKISQDREVQGEKVQFRIVDPPQVPATPSGPNRSMFLSAVLVVSIAAAAGLAWLLASMDDTFASVLRLKQAFRVPVLGTVSPVYSSGRRGAHAVELSCFAMVCLALVAVYGGLLLAELSVGLGNIVSLDLADGGSGRLVNMMPQGLTQAIGKLKEAFTGVLIGH